MSFAKVNAMAPHFPPLAPDNVATDPFGPGVALAREWGSSLEYINAGANAIYETMNTSGCGGFLVANETLLSGSADPRFSNLTWAQCGNLDINIILGPFLAYFSSPMYATSQCDLHLLGVHAYWLPIWACNPMVCPIHVYRTAAQTAWFYDDGKYVNLAGTTIKQSETVGKTQETGYPPGGFSWTIPTAGVGFQRAGVLQAAAHLQENDWIDTNAANLRI